jgi:thiamine biosynthesis lipoprotein
MGALLLCLLLLTALVGCAEEEQKNEPLGMVYFTYFDTVSYVYSYAGDPAELFEERSAGVSRILQEYHQLFDIYHEYAGINNLCTVNRLAGGDPVPVDEKLIDFMLYAKEVYELTGGEMNVMMGAVLRLWHDCRTAADSDPQNAKLPDAALLQEAAEHTDFSLLEIDAVNNTLRISDPAAAIDVGALGKGYATEKAAQQLEAEGLSGYVLNIGGNIRIIGTKPDGSGWLTGIKDPANSDSAYIEYLNLANTSCVTSGIYERFYTVGGVQYHHIIDKDTLMPSKHFSSVSIITKDSGLADALSTALFTVSYEEGRALVDTLDGVEVLWITPDGEKLMTEGFKLLITEQD